jgi:predicted Zn-dependent protease
MNGTKGKERLAIPTPGHVPTPPPAPFKKMLRAISNIQTVLLCLLLTVLVTGCATSNGKRDGFSIISTQEEMNIGRLAAREVERKYTLLRDPKINSYIESVGYRLAEVSDRPDIPYHFKVIEGEEVNAFSLPGGWVYVFTGLLEKLDNTAQLAGVLGHEIGHVVARHAVKRLEMSYGIGILYSAFVGGRAGPVGQTIVKFLIGIAMNGYSRGNEREADRLGMIEEYRAGYNPRGIIQVMETLRGIHHARSSNWQKYLMDHPPPEERIALLEKQLRYLPPEALNYPFYKEKYHKNVLSPLRRHHKHNRHHFRR